MSCLTHAQEVAKILAYHGKPSVDEQIARLKFIQEHNERAEKLWALWNFARRSRDDDRSLRTMIEAQETKHHDR